MKPLRIFRHEVCEPPAYLCTYLDRRGLAYKIICLDEGVAVPMSLDDTAGLIFMGGAGSVNDPKNWIRQELDLIKQAEKQNLPVLGICFGAQLISKALGGSVYLGESMEIGWHTIKSVNLEHNTTQVAKRWLKDLPAQFEAFQWHGHTFTLPPGAIALWHSNCFVQQGFIKNKMLAMQFHLEVTPETVKELAQRYASDLAQASDCVQSAEHLTTNLFDHTRQLHLIADKIYDKWLSLFSI